MSGFTDGVKQVLGTVAPWIGTAIGGPFGAAAGTLLAKALGKKPEDQAGVEAAITTASPETLAAIKKADEDFQVQMTTLGVTKEQLELADVQNARAMEISTKDSTPRNLSYLLLFFTGVIIAAEFFGWAKIDGTLAGTLIGYLISENKAVMTFWFGSSRGSQDKDATIADIAKAP